jgi:S-DNA-T family DNA segregation ATPase FtsK/SpoIIIE
MQQNFKMVLTMQLNDPTDYPVVVGKTDGLLPSKCKGRGLVALDRVYEFQTAYCVDAGDQQGYLRAFCNELVETAVGYARRIPVLPDVVSMDEVRRAMDGTGSVPVGISKNSLEIVSVNMRSKVAFPVVAQDISDAASFVGELLKVLSASVKTVLLDVEQILGREAVSCDQITGGYEEFVRTLFAEMVKRNNDYKDAGMDAAVLGTCEERVYVICGIKKLFDRLSADGKEKLSLLIEKAHSYYKLRFVIVDSLTQLNACAYDDWFKQHLAGVEGLWIGDGVADQYLLKVGKLTTDLYEEVGAAYGYFIAKGRATLVKLLSDQSAGEVQ